MEERTFPFTTLWIPIVNVIAIQPTITSKQIELATRGWSQIVAN